ncbi:carbohydrate kinase [Chitinophaga sp. MM2321]|uniref:carbohydrate kinase family protein n=1 Tax=Chitinophaga sp. MM2321 TaxID=3137178 RepID=UPI0032D593F3
MIVCYGEVLWDVFPKAVKPGGAPMNVAYHLNKLGMETNIISRIGADEEGERMLSQLENWQLSTDWCQQDSEYPTGSVLATMGKDHEMSYEIRNPAAWDYIQWQPEFETLIRSAEAFVFGSLVTRNTVSRHTLFTMLEIAPYRVFDVNIRPPFSSIGIIRELLERVDMVKMNEAELRLLLSTYNVEFTTAQNGARFLLDKFSLKEIIITRGSRGALYLNNDTHYDLLAKQVPVKDTVGSGDSFLAGFLARKLQGKPLEEAMNFAIGLSAFVTTQEGACPDYNPAELIIGR